MQKISKNKGITLVSLVVTIIVLIILAGVTIASINGNDGILSKSKLAKKIYQNSANEENDVLSKYENEIDIASSRENNSGYKETTLLETTATTGITSGKVTFADGHTVDEFDELVFSCVDSSNEGLNDQVILTSTWKWSIKNSSGKSWQIYLHHGAIDARRIELLNLTLNSFDIGTSQNMKIVRITGVKF